MSTKKIRVLYSFPLRLGANRICYTAWQQVKGLAAAGVEVLVFPASLGRPLPADIKVSPTLARGRFRLPFRTLGTERTVALHDWMVARRLEKLVGQIDVIHAWPTGALETLKAAKRLGIPTALERPNAHTRFAMEVVQTESAKLGIALPPSHEHAFNKAKLHKEELEYQLATKLLCPSEFVAKTFIDQGFRPEQLARHCYGFDPDVFHPGPETSEHGNGLRVLFAGVCAVRKGLHYALEAWLNSPARETGSFTIAGEFLPDYQARLAPMLAHPSVKLLGHRTDMPELMRQNDVLVLPSIEEGSALVTYEARGSGCVLMVSDAAGASCEHGKDALLHHVGDTATLAEQFMTLDRDRALLARLRKASLAGAPGISWMAAGPKLLDAYVDTIRSWTATGSRAPESEVQLQSK